MVQSHKSDRKGSDYIHPISVHFEVKWDILGRFHLFFSKKVSIFQMIAVPLYHQNPPSLSMRLTGTGRFYGTLNKNVLIARQTKRKL